MGYPRICTMAAMALFFWAAGGNAQTIPADGQPDILVGTGPGRSLVRLLSGTDGSELISGFPWGSGHTAGVRVAAGDVTGDGVVDLIVATGPGDGRVSAYNGANANLIVTFAPFGNHFRGGVHLATGDIDGDGHTDLIVGGGDGSGRVRIYSSATYQQLVTDFPFGPDYRGGITVAAGDVNGDGHDDVIAAQETGARVRVFDGATFTLLAGGTPYGVGFTGGMYVAAGDVDGDGQAEIITGPRAGSHTVVVLDAMAMQSITSFTPFATGNGISVATGDLDGDGIADLVVGSGAGVPPRVRAFRGPDGLELLNGLAFDPSFLGGVFVTTTAQRAGLRFTSDDEATFEVGVSGTFAITTAGPDAPITMTGTLPTGITFTDNGDGTASLDGTPAAGTGGDHSLTFTAGAGTALEAVQAFTLHVNQAPAITSATSTTFPLGAPGTFTVTTTGFPAPAISLSGAALPTGVTFTDNGDGTATLAGTPDPGTGGTYALIFTAANTVGTDATQAFTLTVDASPVFTSAAATTFQVGAAGTFSITATATPAVTAITVGGAPLPPGVTFTDHGDGTATLAGTPAAGTGGTHALTFTATNGVHAPTVQNFTLTVNQAPAITSAAAATFPLGAPTTFTVTTTGFPAPALTLGGTLPAGLTFADNGNGTGTLSGTPTTGGVSNLTITASNGIGANAVQGFTLTVDSSPGFTSAAAATFSVGVPGTFSITTVGVPAVNTITLGGVALPASLTFVDNGNGTATLSGTPAPGTGGTYALTFTASNGVHAPAVQVFTLTVTQAPAVTSATSTTFTAGTPGTFTVTTTGFPVPSTTLTGALPTGLTFVDNGDGTATLGGTPAAGSGGNYPVNITAANGTVPDAVQAFTLNVNQAPAITSLNTATFSVGAPGTFTVTTTGLPVPALTITGALPAGVTFTDNGDGTATLSGTPAAGTGGSYALTITAANGVGANATQAFTLNVSQGPAITSAASTTFVTGTPGSFTVTTTGSPAPTIAAGGAALPAGVTFVDNGNGTGTLSGTPAVGTAGVYALTFTATNSAGSSAPQAFTLTVSGPPSFTSANTTTFTQGTPGTFAVTAIGSPTPAIAVSGSLPAGVSFLDNGNGTGTLSGTPAPGTSGTYALTFTASNGVLPNGTQAFTLNVNGAPAITSAASTTFTAGAAGSFTVTTSGFPLPTLAIGGGALPAGVTFVDSGNGTGTLAGTPTAGTGGTYAITFTATNAVGASAPQAFALTVNQAPSITSANSVSFVVGTPGTFTVTTTGFPAPAVTRTGVALPAGVTFTDNGNGTGTLSGTPAAGTAGSYAFTFTATNSTPPSAVQAFTLNVNQPPAITSAASTTFTVGTPATFTVTTTGFPTPTVSQTGALPTGVTFTSATRVLGGTATQTGAFPLVFTATNAVPPDATQNFTLNVVCPAITVNPATLPDGLFQTAYGPVNFTQTGSTGTTFTWGSTGLPAGLALSTAGVLSGTPTNTVLNGAVAVTVTDNFGCTGTRNTTITVRPTTDNENYTGGVGNTQYVVGAAVPLTPNVFANDNVKTGDNGPGALTITFPATSSNGIIVEGATDGTFIYTPNVGFAGPTDVFTYTLTDGNGVTNTGTVTMNLSNLVWYVNSAGANGDGRSHNPFNTLASAATASAANSFVYIHTGGATTPGDLAMDQNQTLHGAGAVFTVNGLTLAATARPTLSGTVTLANNTVVRATNFSGAATALSVPAGAYTAALLIDQVLVTGGTTGLLIGAATGVAPAGLTVSNAQFTNLAGAEISISGGNLPVTFPATTTISSNAGGSVTIQNRTGGTVSFASPVTVTTGTGVSLATNTGSTIAFTGGLSLSTGGNPAFTATGGGTVTATQNNTTIVNTITTTTGTALNVANTTIGASGLTFRSISSNGGSQNGIILDSTGATGGLTVTGDGTNTSVGGNASGGTITSKSGADGSTTAGSGIYLNATANVILRRMTINGTNQNFGIRGLNVTGYTMEYSTVTGSHGDNAGLDEGSVNFDNLLGSAAITSSIIEGGLEDNLNVVNTSGTLNRLTITGSTFGFNNTANGNNNILIESQNAGTTLNFTIQSSTIKGARADWINASNNSTSTMNAVIGGSTGALGNLFDNLGANAHAGAAAGGNRVVLGSIGTLTVDVNNNTLRGSKGEAIRVRSTASGATTGIATGYVRNNVIGVQGTPNSGSSEGSGIFAFGDGGSDMTLVISGNTVHQYNNHGIRMTFGDEINDGSIFNVTVTGNTINTPGNINTDFNAIHLDHGSVGATDNFTSCIDIGGAGLGNIVAGGGSGTIPPNNTDVRVRQRQSTTVRLPGYGGANNNDAAVVTYLTGRNTLSTAAASNTVPTGGGFLGGAACTLPPF
jgi:hypothetical protein